MNTRKVNMMESFVTYENHGKLVLDFDVLPELVGKTNQELQEWLNNSMGSLFVHVNIGELRKDKKHGYTQEEIDEAKETGGELESKVNGDKIKKETKSLYLC